MPLRRSSSGPPATATEPAAEPAEDAAVAGKGRPTPKRRDAQKRRRTAAVPLDRKQAAALRREKMREQRQLQRQALMTGDERHLPPRDAGPAKRLARDVVDSRFTLGQIFLVMVVAVFALSFVATRNRYVAIGVNLGMLLLFVGVVVDSFRVARRARALVEAKYGAKAGTGITPYAVMRAMQPRRMRRPPPKVDRGATLS